MGYQSVGLLVNVSIARTNEFKYLGDCLDTASYKKRRDQIELAYHLTKNIYNKRNITRNAKLRHYTKVVRPECLYLNKKVKLKRLRKFNGGKSMIQGFKLQRDGIL